MTLNPDDIQAFARRFARGAMIAPQDSIGLATDATIRSLVSAHLSMSEDQREKMASAHMRDVLAAYGRTEQRGETAKAFPYAGNGTAIIPVHGVLLNRYSYATPYATGYNALRSMLNAAVADADVQRIVLDMNSPGGQVMGLFELAADVRAAKTKKPVHAVVDSMAFSAAYALASSATDITMSPGAEAGSIGVVAMHINFGPALKEMGIEVTFIHAGKHKVDGNPFEALSKETRAAIQADVDRSYDKFVSSVAEGRPGKISEKQARDTEARCYGAEDCVSLGLADAIAAPDAALASFEATTGGSSVSAEASNETATAPKEKEEATMNEIAQAQAEARTAERARIAGILGHVEAKGRETLARHLAENTDMTVEQAGAVLAAAPKAEATSGVSPLDRAMDRTEQPEVGADGGKPKDQQQAADTPQAKADRMWASFQAAGGMGLPKSKDKAH